jgi:Kef-type K+ transport system membrane component KefB
MFTAGLEIDLTDFKKNRNKSIIFGILTFSIPMAIGVPVAYYLLDFSIPSSFLLASMFASHTLLAYPVVSRLGVAKTEPVNVTVGGTLITDTAALLVLAVITGTAKGEVNAEFWLKMSGSILVFAMVVIFGFPVVGRWFFRAVQDSVSQYIFVLAMVFLGAFLAELAGLESIIGAFMAGLALNKLIPHTSPLMNRIEFAGNSLFIPFFLISVGMLVNLKVLFQGTEAIYTASIMITVGLFAKWIAAYITQKILKYNKVERNIIFGLSSAQAAATLAVVLVGYKLGLLNENVLNGTILMILVTCLVSSFVTEKSAKEIAILEEEKEPDLEDISERILVPISNPKTIDHLIDLAVMIKNPDSKQPIYALAVVKDDSEAKEKVLSANTMLEKAVKLAAATDTTVQIVTRVDLNIANGISRASKDLVASDILLGWNAQLSTKNKIFGSVLDNIVKKCPQLIWVCKWEHPIKSVKKMVVVVPKNAEFEEGFGIWVQKIKKLSKELGGKILFYADLKTTNRIKREIDRTKTSAEIEYINFEDWEDFLLVSKEINPDDLLIVIHGRKGSISYHKEMNESPRLLSKHFQTINFIVIYPGGKSISDTDSGFKAYDSFITPIQENIERAKLIGKFIQRVFK